MINGLPLEGVTCSASDNLNESLEVIPPLGARGLFYAHNIRIIDGWYVFDVQTPTETIKDVKFGLPGKHNLTNALLALAMAKTFGTSTDAIVKALATFKGVKRRFSFQIRKPEFVYIDDMRIILQK